MSEPQKKLLRNLLCPSRLGGDGIQKSSQHSELSTQNQSKKGFVSSLLGAVNGSTDQGSLLKLRLFVGGDRPGTTSIVSPKRVKSQAQQERLLVKTLWRQLQRWQGFDSYVFLRDAEFLKEIRGGEQVSQTELVESFSSFSSAVGGLFSRQEQQNEYLEQYRKSQMKKIQQALDSQAVRQSKLTQINQYMEQPSPEAPKSRLQLLIGQRQREAISEVCEQLKAVMEKLQVQEIEAISPFSEKAVALLWKTGVFNFYVLGCFIHCMILELYGREKVSYMNWKRFLRICNMQGPKAHKYKLVGYRHLAKISLNLQQYDKSLTFLVCGEWQIVCEKKKMLKLAWIMDDANFELLAYDMISLVSYYKQDLEKALFFHEKFSTGEFEIKGSALRNVGEQNYLLSQKLKESMLDLNSFSEDDLDLDVLVQKGLLSKWETEQKRKELYSASVGRRGSTPNYKQGPSFGKIKRLDDNTREVVNPQISMKRINEFKSRHAEMLGPVFQKYQDPDQIFRKKAGGEKCAQSVQFLFNQKSTNRVALNYLLISESNEGGGAAKNHCSMGYKPLEQVSYVRKMIKIFIYDLKYYSQRKMLFKSGIDDIS